MVMAEAKVEVEVEVEVENWLFWSLIFCSGMTPAFIAVKIRS
jgi:hypothetical protein